MSAEGIKKLKEYGIAPPIPGTNANLISNAAFVLLPSRFRSDGGLTIS
jgi:hypothetical protein